MKRKLPALPNLPTELAVFGLGLLLFAAGLSWAWLPLGPIGAGVVLMAVAVLGEEKQP